MGVGLAGFERLRSYIDYVANALLQFLVYHIVVNKKEKALAIISQLCIKADDLDKVMDKKLEQQHQKWKINPILVMSLCGVSRMMIHLIAGV